MAVEKDNKLERDNLCDQPVVTSEGSAVRTIQTKYKWYHINTNALPAKFAYFFECGRRIGYNPNLVMFLTTIGLNKAQAGFIVGFRMVGMIFGGPFWGMIADKWHCHRIVLIIMCLASLLTISTQPIVSIYYGNPEINKCPYEAGVDISSISNNSFGANYNNVLLNKTLSNFHKTKAGSEKQYITLYFIMILINVAVSFAEGSSVGFVDTGTLRRSQLSTDRPLKYGTQRMFAAIGAAVGILTTNLAIEYFPSGSITCYAAIFVVYSAYTLLTAISTILLYRGLSFEEQTSSPVEEEKSGKLLSTDRNEANISQKKLAMRKVLFKTLMNWDVMFFYLTTFISGLEYSQFTSFLFLYLKELKAPTILLTLSIVISNVASVIGFAVCHTIIDKLGGRWGVIPFTFLMYFIRYLGISVIQNPWLVLIFQPMHAVSATLYVANGLQHLRDTIPLSIITTAISIFNAIHYGLGTIVGSSISGIIYEKFGGKTLFMSTSFLALFWFFISGLYGFYKYYQSKQQDNNKHEDKELMELDKTPKQC